MSIEDKTKLEHAIIQMMIKFKRVPMEFACQLPKELDDKINERWAIALDTKKRKRE